MDHLHRSVSCIRRDSYGNPVETSRLRALATLPQTEGDWCNVTQMIANNSGRFNFQ
jgi:hypothetical protein